MKSQIRYGLVSVALLCIWAVPSIAASTPVSAVSQVSTAKSSAADLTKLSPQAVVVQNKTDLTSAATVLPITSTTIIRNMNSAKNQWTNTDGSMENVNATADVTTRTVVTSGDKITTVKTTNWGTITVVDTKLTSSSLTKTTYSLDAESGKLTVEVSAKTNSSASTKTVVFDPKALTNPIAVLAYATSINNMKSALLGIMSHAPVLSATWFNAFKIGSAIDFVLDPYKKFIWITIKPIIIG